MTHGLLTGFLRLQHTRDTLASALSSLVFGAVNRADAETLSEHDLRDLGMLDGRVSPSTVDRCGRSGSWDLVERMPHSL